MMSISPACEGLRWHWLYPESIHEPYVLSDGGAQIGWLQFESAEGSRSTAAFHGDQWTFEHILRPHPRIIIREAGSDRPVAEFAPCLTGGQVSFESGARCCWRRRHPWSDQWCFCREEGRQSCVCVSLDAGPLIAGGTVAVSSEAAGQKEAPVLVLLA